ncbi:twin-arginine translocation signal domain-containing protein [Rubrobacter marinus]|uniref:Twin-arginine translocation signal domain-containing protein n=1 Tax=Rubrobacter marinus TaxID=2653852 RepID=A0A6G8PVY2_9ACTN|nr:twin-arginine translocation signal domain-containing protein [Rubrobacter marinus]
MTGKREISRRRFLRLAGGAVGAASAGFFASNGREADASQKVERSSKRRKNQGASGSGSLAGQAETDTSGRYGARRALPTRPRLRARRPPLRP